MSEFAFDRSLLLGQNKNDRADRTLDVLLTVVLVLLVFVLFVKVFWFESVTVDGKSMNMTIEDGDLLVMDKLSTYSYGDIVIVKISENTNYVKRIIGMPGDTIRNDEQGRVHRISSDGTETILDEPYAYFDPELGNGTYLRGTGLFSYTLANDEIFVMGDNRYHSQDGRALGPMKTSAVMGVVHQWVVDQRYRLQWLYKYI